MNEFQHQMISPYDLHKYDQEIQYLYQRSTLDNHSSSIKDRLAIDSMVFYGKPYSLGPAGEGPAGYYDQSPLYRTDIFDCVTYVNTVLALAESDNLQQFQYAYKEINYIDGRPDFTTRNHFMEIDWNINNARKGYVQDITKQIVDNQGKPIFSIKHTLINKPEWFSFLKANNLKFLHPLSPEATQQRLQDLHNQASHFRKQLSQLAYLPMTRLFNTYREPNDTIFQQIPSGAIIEIVDPNKKLKSQIGTLTDISHIGFAIRTPKGLMFREASSYLHRVVDIPLDVYLLNYLGMDSSKGINIQEVLKVYS